MRTRSVVGSAMAAVALATCAAGEATAAGSSTARASSSPENLTCEIVFDALEDSSPEWAEEGIDQVEDWCESVTGEDD